VSRPEYHFVAPNPWVIVGVLPISHERQLGPLSAVLTRRTRLLRLAPVKFTAFVWLVRAISSTVFRRNIATYRPSLVPSGRRLSATARRARALAERRHRGAPNTAHLSASADPQPSGGDQHAQWTASGKRRIPSTQRSAEARGEPVRLPYSLLERSTPPSSEFVSASSDEF
jgi:hypothetical protein